MSSEDHKSTNSVTKLTSNNYPTWKGVMKAYLQVKGLWLLVNGSETCPSDADAKIKAKWDVKADKAAGELYLACSVEQRMHIDAVQDDPVKIWTTLASIHLQCWERASRSETEGTLASACALRPLYKYVPRLG